ncbi:hypothetical protein GCM10010873_24800 [Cypionkella aquatica]|uniref:Lipoprotein n=1 Tax=Cypionkella aquatica TaxID=1756042 RepID=A0AA37U910_9RHOB|nr:hypothetical protein [Cypionkella aquatica]GLS87506.1 hypothetical protein GCM10010873_24800 [Cypionkella aquatica]
MKRILIPALLILSACGTPQQNCISGATRDMRVVDRLIAESEGNLQRGYAIEERTVSRMGWVRCGGGYRHDGKPGRRPDMCFDDIPETVRQPVAIDLQAESAKLAGLKAKRAAQARAAGPSVKACKAQYPE